MACHDISYRAATNGGYANGGYSIQKKSKQKGMVPKEIKTKRYGSKRNQNKKGMVLKEIKTILSNENSDFDQ